MSQNKSAPTKTTKKASGKASSAGKRSSNGTPQQAAVSGTPKTQHSFPVRITLGIVCLLLGVFSAIGYFDTNGAFIALLCNAVKGFAGWGFFFTPPLLLAAGVFLLFFAGRGCKKRTAGALILPSVMGGLLQLILRPDFGVSRGFLSLLWKNGLNLSSGGVLGGGFALLFSYLFSRVGALILFLAVLILLVLMICDMTPVSLIRAARERRRLERDRRERQAEYSEPEPVIEKPVSLKPQSSSTRRRRAIDIPLDDAPASPKAKEIKSSAVDDAESSFTPTGPEFSTFSAKDLTEESNTKNTPPDSDKKAETPPVEKAIPTAADAKKDNTSFSVPDDDQDDEITYTFPPLELLSANSSTRSDGTDEARVNCERLESAFRSFGVNVHIASFTRGPTVTRYEAELEAGIKLNRLTSLSDDIALSLGVAGVRIAAMPNKISTVGIEVPNKSVSRVVLRDIIDSAEFRNSSSPLSFAIGLNIGGDAIVGNISKLPHLLVAGTTGSGKSVCLNSLIISILYKSTPDEVRFIMIDPKMVEFRIYNGIPHLLVPVVTDVKKAAGALQWAVVEMMKRYRLFSEIGARDIDSYNQLVIETEEGTHMSRIVVVIDELADLMLQAAKEVEESICRVAQMGRAAGIHLIIATQSPRADVITGLMKANIPSRIALKVSSSLESRIILDAGGNADKLIGNGDMLYAPIGVGKPIRIQGTWVSDAEREKVVNFIKKSGEAEYAEDVISQIEKAAEDKSSKRDQQDEEAKNDYDELLPQAVDVIFDSGQASVSMLQRRLKLGYSRAARIVDQMEEIGIVGPFEGSKPRQILITRQQWQEMQFVNGTAPIEQPYQAEEETPVEEIPFDM